MASHSTQASKGLVEEFGEPWAHILYLPRCIRVISKTYLTFGPGMRCNGGRKFGEKWGSTDLLLARLTECQHLEILNQDIGEIVWIYLLRAFVSFIDCVSIFFCEFT